MPSLPRLLTPCLVLLCSAGCAAPNGRMEDSGAYLRLLMPTKLEIQHFTRPVSLHGDGQADGLEVMVTTLDSFGDQIKAVGTFNVELYQERQNSTDHFGKRVANWSVRIDSEAALRDAWDSLAHVFLFRLKLPLASCPADRYALTVQLNMPGDVRLFDEFRFQYAGGLAPNVTPLNREISR